MAFRCKRFAAITLGTLLAASVSGISARAATDMPQPLVHLRAQMHALTNRAPGSVAFDVEDLATGYRLGYRANITMPAASTIKVPIMVEVFRQLEAGKFTLAHRVALRNADRDDGSGDLAYASDGESFNVRTLLHKMIDVSDNTAANMLLRLVGKANVNATMTSLGLEHTEILAPIRTDTWNVRETLRSDPSDMLTLFSAMAHGTLVDAWASREMIAILEHDEFDSLLPEPLPAGTPIAHKTGSFHDTLDDVGIVYEPHAAYAIAVMTTGLENRSVARHWIHRLSRETYRSEGSLALWRNAVGIADFSVNAPFPSTPDIDAWSGGGR